MSNRKYWVAVASYNHVKVGVEQGFAQVCHGKKKPLSKLSENDVIFYYSPNLKIGSNVKYQYFSAIGRIVDNNVYSYKMTNDFTPYRRDVEFYTKIQHADYHKLKTQLDFTKDPKKVGLKFRTGLFQISYKDAMVIWSALRV